jgi:tetratricopeptide (TPR) repeat protein
VPAGLIYKNFPHIRANTRPFLSQLGVFQAQVLKEIAPQGAVVLSDDPYRLFALDAALRRSGGGEHYVLVDTTSLAWIQYHRHLSERYPQQWLQPPEDTQGLKALDPGRLVQLIGYLGQSRNIYYLHPSFGYYFEYFYLKPRKLVYELKIYPTNSVLAPSLSVDELAAQEKFWTDCKSSELSPLLRDMKRLQIKDESNLSLAMAGVIYSRSVNDFAVSLQKAGHFNKAAGWFETALELNPRNPSAYINLDYNRLLQAGQRENPTPSEGAVERLGAYGGNTDALLRDNGPVDEPNLCFRVANAFAQGRNFRQAAQYLMRVIDFLPGELNAHMALVSTLNQIQWHDRALAHINLIRTEFATNLVNSPEHLELVQAEALAYLGRKDFAAAENVLLSAQKAHPKSAHPFSALAELYLSQNQLTNAMKILDEALQKQPNEPAILKQYARIKFVSGDFAGAIPYLDRALEKDGKDVLALLNRAFANLKIDQLESAQRDYESLEALAPDLLSVVYGLHEVHWRKKNRKSAIKYAEKFVKASPDSTEGKELQGRLVKLESGSF